MEKRVDLCILYAATDIGVQVLCCTVYKMEFMSFLLCFVFTKKILKLQDCENVYKMADKIRTKFGIYKQYLGIVSTYRCSRFDDQ